MRRQVVILAAGLGTRLGRPVPKPLTPLADGRTILQQQVDHIRAVLADPQIYVVVGFKHEMIMEAHPDLVFVYNESYDRTNTSKSLLRALRASNDGGVVWMNGDVVFDPKALERLLPRLDEDVSSVLVDRSETADEEVKYRLDADGRINALSKTVTEAVGEAVGINFISSTAKAALVRRLEEVAAQDYFERGIELMIENDGEPVVPVDITDLYAVEVDDDDDLRSANAARARAAQTL